VITDGQVAQRPTLLPVPGELPQAEPAIARLSRLARFGGLVCSPRPDRPESGEQPGAGSCDAQARLFFDYLRGEYGAAAADLEHLAPFLSSAQERLSLLSLRAQILWARGERAEALAVIDYLVSSGEPNRRSVEETPLGLVFSPYITPNQAWARYLSAQAADGLKPTKSQPATEPPDIVDPRLLNPLLVPDAPVIERGAGRVPFAPIERGRKGLE
jgi:hypothetical protein